MGKLSIFVFLLFLAALGLFAVENKDVVTIKVPFGSVYEISKVALMLLSTTMGALVILLVFFVRDTRRAIESIQYQRRQKREEKIQGFYSRALNAIISDRAEEAQASLEEVLKEIPDHTDSLLRLGDIALKKGEYKAAIEHYKKVLDLEPSNLQALFSLSTVMERMKRNDNALKYLDEILEIDSGNNTAFLRKRSIMERMEDWDGLISLQKGAIKLSQGEGKQREEKRLLGYNYEYARAGLENGELEKAEKSFRAMMKTDVGFVPAYLGLTEVLLGKGETEEAISLLEKAYEQQGSVIILARLEDLLISAGEPGRLLRSYKSAIARNPQDDGLRFLLGKLYYRLEMVDDAMEVLDSMDLSSLPIPELSCLKGELYMKRNQASRAMAEFRRACTLGKSLRSPYCCTACGLTARDWSGRCPRCGEWNTFNLDIHGNCKA